MGDLVYEPASIGPCPFKHGKSEAPGERPDSQKLQLGHVLSNMVSE